eukprot:4898602-Pyramimonas_sp.AAC.1
MERPGHLGRGYICPQLPKQVAPLVNVPRQPLHRRRGNAEGGEESGPLGDVHVASSKDKLPYHLV